MTTGASRNSIKTGISIALAARSTDDREKTCTFLSLVTRYLGRYDRVSPDLEEVEKAYLPNVLVEATP
jgi:hypothetical protein